MAGDRSSKTSRPGRIRGTEPTLVPTRTSSTPRRARGDEPTLMAPTMIVLYRPVDEGELAKIEKNGYRAYPPLVGAFVVYAQEKFARTMVGPGGWLTRFTLTSDVIGRYTRDGASPTEHYLIPPSDIDRINESIVGPIQVLRSA